MPFTSCPELGFRLHPPLRADADGQAARDVPPPPDGRQPQRRSAQDTDTLQHRDLPPGGGHPHDEGGPGVYVHIGTGVLAHV